MSLADFTQKNIFIPAGMTHSQYQKKDTTYEADMPFENTYGDGTYLQHPKIY